MRIIRRGTIRGHLCFVPFLVAILSITRPLLCQDTLPNIPVTISSKIRTIHQILDEISLQSGYNFTYNAELITGKQKVHFQADNLPLEKTLDSLLRDPRFAYKVIDRNIVIYEKNISPPIPISQEINRSLLKGQVHDSHSGKPLSYATVALFGTNLGSITNQEGEFSFKIPTNLSDPLIVVSYMGYKNKLLAVNYPLEKEVHILLEKEMIPLQEVIIRYTDPELLIREALSRIPDNYLDEHSTMTAYYRESVKRNDHCTGYSEALLDVAKSPYSQPLPSDRVRIRKGRKIVDYTTEDTVLIKLRSGIYTSLDLDIIKKRPDFLANDFPTRYDLEFTDLMSYGERLVYVISFTQKSTIPEMLFQGQLFIDQQNLALVAADFEYNPVLIQKEPGLFLVSHSPAIRIRPIMARYHVDYREVHGRYHLNQVRAEVEMKVRRRRHWIGARYLIALEMAITDVNPDQRLKINASERVDPHMVLSDEPFQFDPSFWGIHNTIKPEASLMESIQQLEHNLQEISE